MTEPVSPNPRTRDLLLALEVGALVLAGVVIFAWLTDAIPAVRDALSFAPVVIVGLVVVTILVLARALWPRRP